MFTCTSCGQDNPDSTRYCGACGAPFVATASREVRKTVTVLFVDVSGSTALGERLDPEALRHVLARYFDAARGCLERHGGTVEKFIGDAVMAVFGVPTLHEDDAMRALRAASELRDSLASLNEELERDFGVSLQLRTGVNTGEVVAGTEERLVTGDAVNVAARLEQAAQPGEILVGEHTRALASGAIDVEPVEPLALKGKTEPFQVYRLMRILEGAQAVAGYPSRLVSPMVGRERERRRLSDAFDQAVSDHSCQLFTVLGAAGVGKSRLVLEFLDSIDGGVALARGRCLPYGEGITYWPVLEAVVDLAGINDTESSERSRQRLAELLVGEEDADRIAQRMTEVLGLSPADAGVEESIPVIRRFFEAVAARQPLVVVFDDIHWGETTFLDLVEHLADWSRGVPFLLVCMARPELHDVRPTWGGGKLNATSVLLEPLSEDECAQLVVNLVGDVEPVGYVAERITDAAEGNPFFVEEMLSMLIDDGFLVRDDARWKTVGDLTKVPVPPTIPALLAARLDRLTDGERTVIERAAVEGKLFHRGSVEALTRTLLESPVGKFLGSLVRKELIRPDKPFFPGEEAYRFRHLLIRDAAYDSIPKEVRADLHELHADWLETKATAVEYDEIAGYHLEQAFRYRAELGPVDENARAARPPSGRAARERRAPSVHAQRCAGRSQSHLASGRVAAPPGPASRRARPQRTRRAGYDRRELGRPCPDGGGRSCRDDRRS